MPQVQIEGVGTVEVSDDFLTQTAAQQEATIKSITSSVTGQTKAPKQPQAAAPPALGAPPAPDAGLAAPEAPQGDTWTQDLRNLGVDGLTEQAIVDYLAGEQNPTADGLNQFAVGMGAAGMDNAQEVLDFYQSNGTVAPPEFKPQDEAPPPPAETPQPEESWGDTFRSAAKTFGGGVGDLVEVAGDTFGIVGNPVNSLINSAAGTNLTTDIGASFREASGLPDNNNPYSKAINQGGASAMTGMGLAGLAGRGATGVTKVVTDALMTAPVAQTIAGANAGVAGQVAEDLGGGPIVQAMASLAGGATSFSVGARVPKEARVDKWVDKQIKKNPETAAVDAENAKDLYKQANSAVKTKGKPSGRAKVTAKEIGSIERSYTERFKERINVLDIPKSEKVHLKSLLDNPMKAKDAELDAIRGTVYGDAIADGVKKQQNLYALTPEVRPAGSIGGAISAGLDWVPGIPAVATKFLQRRIGGEAARVNNADKLVKNKDYYDALQKRTGPSGAIESKKAFEDMTDTLMDTPKASKVDPDARTFSESKNSGATDERDLYAKADAVRRTSVLKEAKATETDSKAAAKEFDKNFPELKPTKPKAPAPPKPPSPLDEAIEANIKNGVEGSSGTHAAFASRVGVPVEDMVRGLDKIAKNFPGLSDEIERIKLNYPTKTRGLAAVLVPAMKKALTDDGTVGKLAAQAKQSADLASARMKMAEGAAPAAPAAPTQGPAPRGPAPQAAPQQRDMKPIGRPEQWEAAKDMRIKQAEDSIQSFYEDRDIPDEVFQTIGNAPKDIMTNFKTVEEARDYIDNSVIPDLEIEGISGDVISRVRERLMEITNPKPYATKADYEAGMKPNPIGRPRKETRPDDDVPF
jgi:hypothetical protein